MAKRTILRATKLFNGKRFQSNLSVVIEGDTIVDVSKSRAKADYTGVVTPAFIDAHSHIGMFRYAEPGNESEGNDHSSQIRASHDPINAIYMDDLAFDEAIAFGVLYSCIIPGSGNLFGGRAKVIRHFAASRDSAEFADYGYKMALGFNPRSPGVQGWKGERPNTRMGIYALLEKRFDDLIVKRRRHQLELERQTTELREKASEKGWKKKELERRLSQVEELSALQFDEEERHILRALSGEHPIKVHVHKEDDVIYLLHLVEKYGLKVSAEHCSDVHTKGIFDLLGKAGIPVVLGPLGCLPYKLELKNMSYRNVGVAMKSRARLGVMTDHPVVVTSYLREALKYFLIHGAKPEYALSLLTSENADILGIADSLGSIAPGKLASVLVWNTDPLNLAAMPQQVFAEGRLVHKHSS